MGLSPIAISIKIKISPLKGGLFSLQKNFLKLFAKLFDNQL